MGKKMRFFLVVISAFVLSNGGRAQGEGCAPCGGGEAGDRGKLTKVKAADVESQLCGFSAYNFREGWLNSRSYQAKDTVLYNGLFWKAVQPVTGVHPSFESEDWKPTVAVKYQRRESKGEGLWETSNGMFVDYYIYEVKREVDDCDIKAVSGSASGYYGERNVHFTTWELANDLQNTTFVYDPNMFGEPYTETLPLSIDYAGSHYFLSGNDYIIAYYNEGGYFDRFEVRTETKLTGHLSYGYYGDAEEDYEGTLSLPKYGKSSLKDEVAAIGQESWFESNDWPTAWMGSWVIGTNRFNFTARAVKCWVVFGCLSNDGEIDIAYKKWRVGQDEEDAVEGHDSVSVKALLKAGKIKDHPDGREAELDLQAEDGYYKKFLWAAPKRPEESGAAGQGNGGHAASTHWWVSLGKEESGSGVGNLRIDEGALTLKSATPERLRYDGQSEQVEVVEDSFGGIQQVKSVEAFADVVLVDSYSYEIRFYRLSQIGSKDEDTGKYPVTGTPFSVWRISNPDGSSTVYNKLKIEHIEGGSESYLFSEDLGSGLSSLSKAGGAQAVERTKTVLSSDTRQEVVVTKSGGAVSSKWVETYRNYPWGEKMIQEVLDPDGAALTTTWTYYDDDLTDGAAYTRLKSVTNSDGSWTRYEYDSEGREIKEISTYLDGVIGAAENQSRVTETSYSGDGLTIMTVEKVLGEETGRRYWVSNEAGSEIKNIVCTEAGAGVSAASNLVTLTTYVSSGAFRGEVESITNPDGTRTEYTRTENSGSVTTTVRSGAVNGGSIVSGRETTTEEDAMGRLVSRSEKDIASGIVLETMTVTERDADGRETSILYSDSTTEEKTYACCGVESEKDRNGVITNYTYDSLKRVVSESKNGLTTLYSYDASGRVLTTTRRGSDSSDIVTETLTYDLAGRMASRKDTLNQTTTYSETINGSSQKMRTTTLPDGSTQVEMTHRDGQLKEISGTASRPVKYEYGTAAAGSQFTKEIRIGEGGSENEWRKTYRDFAGRTARIEYSGGAEEAYYYNALGQLIKQVDPDGVARLYAYNAEGEQIEQAIDTDGSGTVNNGDRRTKTLRSVVAGPLVRTFIQQGSDSGYVTVSTMDASPNGRYQKVVQHGLETVTQTTYASNGDSTTVTTHLDGSTSTTEYENGRLVATERRANGGAVIASVTYEYDPHGRLSKQTDGRVGTETTYTYNDADQTTSVSAGSMVTSYAYNNLGQVVTETLPGTGRTITRTYLPTGEVLTEGGSATYPITYTYDPQGRRRTMVTSSGTTTWNYSGTRGWLTSKADAQNESTSYTYTPAGRLRTRTWARGIVTTYGYNGAGELASVDYSDDTPDVTFTYDSQGRQNQITDASGTRTLSYNAAGQFTGESISGGILNGVSLSATYDGLLRRSSFTAARNSTTLASSSFTYDGASRLATVSSGDQTAAYNYLAGSSLVSQVAFKQNGTPAMTTTKSYDALNRLSSISSAPAVGDPVSYAYDYNAAGQREKVTLANNDTWSYGYNSRGEVISGSKKQGGTTNLLGYQFEYDYDDLGNRTTASNNGRTSTYSTNNLNQYTSRTVPGYADVIGKAKPTTSVTVNSLAVTRQGEDYHKELSADNSTVPVYLSTSVKGTLGSDTAEVNGKLFIPKTPEAFTYDKDGNLISDGRWTYQWDGENRLIGMETQPSAAAAGTPKQRLTFAYDQQCRRISKKVEDWKGSRYQERFTMLFLYDGWNLAAEVLAAGPRIRSYVWGSDLSGGTAAGGVGGLLLIGQYPESRIYSVGYDGHGNVMTLFDMGASGALAGSYEYSPWGGVLRKNGMAALMNPFRFSTKYMDDEGGLVYYGYRFYDPIGGRWLTRDPIGERGGVNLYEFNYNSPLMYIDPLGLSVIGKGCCSEKELDKIAKEYSMKASRKTQSDIDPKREYGGIICCKNGKLKASEPHPGPRPRQWQTPSGQWETGRATIDPHRDASTGRVVSCAGLFWFAKGAVEVAAYHSHPDNSNFSGLDQGYANRKDYPFYKGTPDGNVERLDPDATKKGSSDEDIGPVKVL